MKVFAFALPGLHYSWAGGICSPPVPVWTHQGELFPSEGAVQAQGGLRQDSSLQSQRVFQSLLVSVVPLDEGVLVHLDQLNVSVLHQQRIASDNQFDSMVVSKN